MKELEVLLNKRWILKSREKETYYKIRDALGELRKFTTEKMGCQIIDNSLLIKMEKIPVIPESFMGIQKFSSKEEYAYLCILLMFLEDRDAQEQFILSQLTEYITANLPGDISDWTLYTNRRKLIRVLRFAVDQGIVDVTDGKDEAFMDDEAGEVLYENTGASRYFMKNFSKDIMEYTKPEDFRESDWFEVDEDRGFARRHRVYKRLIFAPGMYKEDGSPEDFEYLKYYGRRLSEELEQIFDCQVHIHRGSAYLLSGDDCRMGTVFPGNNSISDILLLCFGEIRKKIENGEWKTAADESCLTDRIEFENLIKDVKQEYGSGFSKNYREMPEGEFVKSVIDAMELWMFIRKGEAQLIRLRSARSQERYREAIRRIIREEEMMNSRWQANKIGLINFWYYDEQEFPFVKGRMLLRGSNGSGKSVTMQSVVPLLLDGNMSPERLDPFGSRDRKMSSYLLEEDDGREERTGYLYLEFKRQDSDTYLTIGMGIRARKGKIWTSGILV